MRQRLFDFALVLTISGSALLGSCDPVHQAEIARLGGEAPGVRTGPLHRPGQPCITCHITGGPGSPNFTVAGTVFQFSDVQVGDTWQPKRDPAVGAQVLMTDALGRSYTATTNEAGNFYLVQSEFDPAYPVFVKLCTGEGCDPLATPPTAKAMKTHIGRDGSCATCHFDPEGPASAGHVYLEDPATP